MKIKRHVYEILSVQVTGPYTLRLEFDDRSVRTVNLHSVLRGELFAPLRDLKVFNQVRLDSEIGTIVWPNGADFDPAVLHDWPECKDAMAAMAAKWDDCGRAGTPKTLQASLHVAEAAAEYGKRSPRAQKKRRGPGN